MTELDFDKKINYRRVLSYKQDQRSVLYSVVRCFESDRGRIINSAAIRRLQQKTQVFPLERNAVVRSRLTHSLEVQQVGRYIVKEVLHRLAQRDPQDKLKLQKWGSVVESLVEMACLMHDIGNPPFGHFGEAAIKQWFSQRLGLDQPSAYAALADQANQAERNQLRQKMRQDLCQFEGNAQAIRLVHSLLKLNLTYSQTACILKYTKPAYWHSEIPPQYSYLMKKPGFYLSEEPFIKQLQQELAMDDFHRFPLTYIMEAADDISYCIADLDDAVEKRIFSVDQLYEYLRAAWGKVSAGDLFTQTVEQAYKVYQNYQKQNLLPTAIDQFFMLLRVKTVNHLVAHAAERFIENLPEIFAGAFNQALLEDRSAEDKLLQMFKTTGNQHVFNHDSVETAELQGYRIISGLLDMYGRLLDMPSHDFYDLVQKQSLRHYPIESRLFHKLSSKHCVAYQQAVEQYQTADDFELWEFYYRCRLIQDYISGMTDHFAYDEYRSFMVAD